MVLLTIRLIRTPLQCAASCRCSLSRWRSLKNCLQNWKCTLCARKRDAPGGADVFNTTVKFNIYLYIHKYRCTLCKEVHGRAGPGQPGLPARTLLVSLPLLVDGIPGIPGIPVCVCMCLPLPSPSWGDNSNVVEHYCHKNLKNVLELCIVSCSL